MELEQFKDWTEQYMENIFESLKNCIGFVDHIDALLKIYGSTNSIDERSKINFDFPINKIESEIGYYVFLKMIGADYKTDNPEELKEKPEGYVPFGKLLPILTFETSPFLPWKTSDYNKLIYSSDTEDIYLKFNEKALRKNLHKVSREEICGIKVFDHFHDAIICKMKEFPRSSEVLQMYANYLLAEKLGKKIEFVDKNISKSKFYKLEELFKLHYEKIGAMISKLGILPEKININDSRWETLVDLAKTLIKKIVDTEENNKEILELIRSGEQDFKNETISKKNDLDFLIEDIHQLFKSNNHIPFEYGEFKFPTMRTIKEFKNGGPTIVNRIGVGVTVNDVKIKGVQEISLAYKEFLDKKVKPEITLLENEDDLSLHLKREELSATLKLLRNEEMRRLDQKVVNFLGDYPNNVDDMDMEVVDLDNPSNKK